MRISNSNNITSRNRFNITRQRYRVNPIQESNKRFELKKNDIKYTNMNNKTIT